MSNVIPLNNISPQQHDSLEYETRAQFLSKVFDGKEYIVAIL